MNRLRHPKTAVRWRLTLLYGGLFLACGAALLAVTYGLVSHAPVSPDPGGLFVKAVNRKPVSSSTPDKQARIPSETLPPGIRRVLNTPDGKATVKFVGARQRI